MSKPVSKSVSKQASAVPHPLHVGQLRRRARRRSEYLFRAVGVAAIVLALLILANLIWAIVKFATPGFFRYEVQLPVTFHAELILDSDGSLPTNASGEPDVSETAMKRVLRAAYAELLAMPVALRSEADIATREIHSGKVPRQLQALVNANPELIGTRQDLWFYVDSYTQVYLLGRAGTISESSQVTLEEAAMIDRLQETGQFRRLFDWGLITRPDSRSDVEFAGLRDAIIGSLLMVLVVAVVAISLGVLTAVFLEEFAPKNRLTDLIEININNLAAVPSIVFGILGLAIFVPMTQLLGGRSAPLVGGLVLSLMTLPTVIIATRAALLAVPPSFKQAAIGMGASKMQAVFQFVLPRALPGIVTGSTIGLAQAIGETAPLLMIGMNNFVIKNEIPLGLGLFKEPFPALPTTIFLWASYADPLLSRYKANAAIVILLLLVFTFLAIATYIRRRANSANS